jgi:hypothetical protein
MKRHNVDIDFLSQRREEARGSANDVVVWKHEDVMGFMATTRAQVMNAFLGKLRTEMAALPEEVSDAFRIEAIRHLEPLFSDMIQDMYQ